MCDQETLTDRISVLLEVDAVLRCNGHIIRVVFLF
jgi:hypothetical protein